MPPLKPPQPQGVINLPSLPAIDAGSTEVLVVGGGPAGIGAALGAAWAGARTVLCERYGFLGGNATAALVAPFASWHTGKLQKQKEGATTLSPTDHGEGIPTIGGALTVFVNRLTARSGAIGPTSRNGYVVPFDAEVFKAVALDLLDEARSDYLLHSLAVNVVTDGAFGVVFATKSGHVILRAKIIVDCTGDGDIAACAGARYEVGREEDGLVQPMTLIFKMAEYESAAFAGYAKAHPGQWRGVHGLWDLVRKAAQAGELDLPRDDILLFATNREDVVTVDSTRVPGSGTDVWDLTYAEWQSRRQMQQISAFLAKYVPGFQNAYVQQSGATVGVRETRRIIGEYVLTADDVLSARKFDDVIAHGTYPIDIHSPTGKGTVLKRVKDGDAYDIPLRCLIPEAIDNIITAGRCISGTHEALSSYRVMPISLATGQAAGVCAALSVRHGITPRHVSHREVRKVLEEQGAIFLH